MGRTSRNILAPAVKDVILMAQDYILRAREIWPEFWLALAEGVDSCWEMKIQFDKNWFKSMKCQALGNTCGNLLVPIANYICKLMIKNDWLDTLHLWNLLSGSKSIFVNLSWLLSVRNKWNWRVVTQIILGEIKSWNMFSVTQ